MLKYNFERLIIHFVKYKNKFVNYARVKKRLKSIIIFRRNKINRNRSNIINLIMNLISKIKYLKFIILKESLILNVLIRNSNIIKIEITLSINACVKLQA